MRVSRRIGLSRSRSVAFWRDIETTSADCGRHQPGVHRPLVGQDHRSALLLLALSVIGHVPPPALAQTDYYNIDSGRPVQIEDAYPVERHAFEAQIAPLRMERRDDGAYHWEFEPELGYGILPGTQL